MRWYTETQGEYARCNFLPKCTMMQDVCSTRKAAHAETLLTYVQEAPGSNLVQDTDIPKTCQGFFPVQGESQTARHNHPV
jgi:hypothetical protein